MQRIRIRPVLIFLTIASALPAQERELDIPRSSDPGRQPFLRNFVRDEWRMFSSPFRKSSYDTPTVKKYIIPFAMISAGLIASDRKISYALPTLVWKL